MVRTIDRYVFRLLWLFAIVSSISVMFNLWPFEDSDIGDKLQQINIWIVILSILSIRDIRNFLDHVKKKRAIGRRVDSADVFDKSGE